MNKISLILLVLFVGSCGSSSKLILPLSESIPDAIVYKTKADYTYFVPVSLSEDGKTILSYPHPSDLKTNGQLAIPTKLKKGYLLDNRGIGPRVAFTNYTYIDYAALISPPTPEKLLKSIMDSDPLLEMYNCGKRADIKSLAYLNEVIKNKFISAKKVK